MKGKLKYCIIGLGIIIAGGLLVSLLYNSYNKKTHENQADMLIEYLENLMRIELKDYIETCEGSVTIKEGEENHSVIKIKVLKEYEETVLELLKDHYYEVDDNGKVYANVTNNFNKKYEAKDWEYLFMCFVETKYAMSKTEFMFVAYDEEGMYAYFFL